MMLFLGEFVHDSLTFPSDTSVGTDRKLSVLNPEPLLVGIFRALGFICETCVFLFPGDH